MTSNLVGDAVEFELCKQLSQAGWTAKHMGSNHPGYDIIASKPNVRAVLIQSKTAYPDKGSYLVKHRSTSGVYGPHDYDVLAAYMPDFNQYTLFLRSEIGNRTNFRFWRDDRQMRSGAIPYRGHSNWDLLLEITSQ